MLEHHAEIALARLQADHIRIADPDTALLRVGKARD
jgi:hypothetical protein